MWSGGFPLALDRARGNRVTDVDGHEYVDLAMGDTGAMAGHSPQPTVDAVQRRIGELGGITTMLPTEDAEWVGAELARRFGLPLWSFTLTATDANRWALRLARLATGRPKVLTFAYCYHGSVDEAFAVPGPDGTAVARAGLVGAPVPLAETTRVAEFNDLAGVEAQLAHGDVAAMLAEPALTNIGIVLPEPGFLEGLRELATRYGALLVIDETHTFSAGPGGATALWGLRAGHAGDRQEHRRRRAQRRLRPHRGAGRAGCRPTPTRTSSTSAGWAARWPATRCRSPRCAPPSSRSSPSTAFERMVDLATAFTAGVQDTLDRTGVPWSVSRLGARAEYRFASPAPRDGSSSAAAGDDELDEYLHLFMANRGVLVTPFHNMALMCPATTADDVDLHTRLFAKRSTG